jgi:hypothetical protein
MGFFPAAGLIGFFGNMSGKMRYLILASIVALTTTVAFLSAPSQTTPDGIQCRKDHGGFGTAEEAFEMSCRFLQENLLVHEGWPVCFDPHFRATVITQSKIWTVKGYASCPHEHNKSYRWTVILSYHGEKDWEILARIVTPESNVPGMGQTDGIPQIQGKLLDADAHDGVQRDRETEKASDLIRTQQIVAGGSAPSPSMASKK